jgi:hypothetical protein
VKTLIALALAFVMAAHPAAQSSPMDTAQLWRAFVETVDLGSTLQVRLHNGQRFNATLVHVGPDTLMLQPKTRRAVPVQAVPYADILSLERGRKGGVTAARAAAIGVGAGVGAFFLTMLLFIAAIDD